MVNVIKTLGLNGSVLSIGYSDSAVYAVDNTYTLYVIDKNSFDLVKSQTVTKNYESPHKYANLFSVSSKNYFCMPFIGTKKGVVLSLGESLAKIATIDWHDADIEVSAFSDDGRFLSTGGADGRAYIYEEPSFRLLTSLGNRADYISALSFSKNNDFIAASGFDKFTTIFDFSRNKLHSVVQTIDVVDRAKFFDGNKKLYMIARNGASIVYDLEQKKTISTENLFHAWPNSLDISDDEKYAIVGSRSESVFVVRLEDNVKMLDIKLEHPSATAMKFLGNYLLMGFISGALIVIDYKKGLEALESAVKSKDYKKAREAIDQNLFLTINPLTKIFDEDWPDMLQKAIELLNKDAIEAAVEVVNPFLQDPKKQSEFNFYLMQKGNVAAFAQTVENKDYQKAYELAEKSKFLQKTSAYIELEAAFNKHFSNAKKLLEENAVMNMRSAEALLKPFALTVKKDIIYMLLKNSTIFKQADIFIKAKNFKAYFSLMEKAPFLTDTDLYKKVQILGEKMVDSLNDAVMNNNTQAANDVIKYLADFPQYKKLCSEKIDFMKIKDMFMQAIAKHDIKKVYAIIEKYENLRALKEFKEFQEDFDARFAKAKSYAYDGEPKRVILTMSIYMEIEYWKDKIASLLKISYLQEIAKYAKDTDVNWDMTFKRYISRYSKDSELFKVAQESNLSKILEAIDERGDANGYRYHDIADYIVVHNT